MDPIVLIEIKDGVPGVDQSIPFTNAFTNFFTATSRAGCQPSDTLELLGTQRGIGNAISFGRVRISAK